ncbi:hypothetical protein KIL84_001471 [Mauremys mutica]|uniref:H/ACA ribonucleoprotein complex non-core subunit NAF1 n=1 Tax=Mauremys mutica TaxID=74926 RepID=A0A9D3X0B9_9SAUR|nr:hypothetical protein KIL84_001471 [Mauremys mutica]
MEVVEQLETLKFDNGLGSPSTAGPQPGQEEPAGGEEPGQEEPAGGEEPGQEEPAGGEEPGQEEPAGGEEPGQASAPAAGGAPGARGPQEEQPGEGSADSDSDTDSDSSSSVSSSSCSLSIGSVESDSQQNGNNTSYHVKPKDELPLEQGPPPVDDLTIILPEDVELKPFGTVSSIIEQLVIIESLKGLPPVNEESIIFKGDRHAAGKIYEIFGPVLHPFYVLLFNSPEHIEAKGINIQDTVYFAPSVEDFTQYIFTEKLKQEKGSDASWQHDQEPPPEALDFSDDETERQRKQKKKKAPNQERKKPKSEVNESNGGHQQRMVHLRIPGTSEDLALSLPKQEINRSELMASIHWILWWITGIRPSLMLLKEREGEEESLLLSQQSPAQVSTMPAQSSAMVLLEFETLASSVISVLHRGSVSLRHLRGFRLIVTVSRRVTIPCQFPELSRSLCYKESAVVIKQTMKQDNQLAYTVAIPPGLLANLILATALSTGLNGNGAT